MELEKRPNARTDGNHQAPPIRVALPPGAPFDLDAYAAQYQGRKKVQRLLFVAESCPALAVDAFSAALDAIKSSVPDANAYSAAVNGYNSAAQAAGRPKVVADERWIEDTRRGAESASNKLEVQLRNDQNALNKDAIRASLHRKGQHEHRIGELTSAIRTHIKAREYCTSASHVLTLCLAVIDIALEMGNYQFVRNYTMKGEAALESHPSGKPDKGDAAKAKAAQVHMPGMMQGPSGLDSKEKERLRIQERLDVAFGLGFLAQGQYGKAARAFLKVGREGGQSPGSEGFISPGDLAVYAVLCALASFERGDVKRLVSDNTDFRPLLEFEPHLKDVVSAFKENRYRDALTILERYEPRYLLDLHLSPHVSPLLESIRCRAVTQFFSPFSSVSLSRCADSFGWPPAHMESFLLTLIESGRLPFRLDAVEGVFTAKEGQKRKEVFDRCIEVGEGIERTRRAALLRLKLARNDVIVRDTSTVRVKGRKAAWEEPS